MSSALNHLHRAEYCGTQALCRSRHIALACMSSLGLALLPLLLWEHSAHTMRVAAPSPAVMEMRVLPPPTMTKPVPEQPPSAPVLHRENAVAPLPASVPQRPNPAPRAETPRPSQKKPPAAAKPVPHPPQTVAATPTTETAEQTAPHPPTGTRAGSGAQAAPATEQAQRVALHILMQAVEKHKHYPRNARRTNAQGTVTLLVRIGKDGTVQTCTIQQGSGSAVLDGAARQLGKKLHGMDSGLRGGEFQVLVPVRYSLV